MMKYIIFEDEKTGMRHPIFLGQHTTHSMINVSGAKPISAGSFAIDEFGNITTCGNSVSLGLSPKEGDEDLIYYAIAGFGTSHFLK